MKFGLQESNILGASPRQFLISDIYLSSPKEFLGHCPSRLSYTRVGMCPLKRFVPGQVHPYEVPEAALVRELKEELSIEVRASHT